MENVVVWFLLLYTNPLVAVPLPGIASEKQCQDIAAHTFFGSERGMKKPDFVCVDTSKSKRDQSPSGTEDTHPKVGPVGPDGKMGGGDNGL